MPKIPFMRKPKKKSATERARIAQLERAARVAGAAGAVNLNSVQAKQLADGPKRKKWYEFWKK